ncbi:maleylacetoacetate isomerase [Aliikangiella marina]|uniref:Maleylacetoacetate isomerase n=1 Tax=Aliikangiella marina TaxID=1712262 RepID=A0A545T2U9_9GAMM|nr:maleylacetoacetate isomerase [Aliikangiella marina]TQV71528.1 maleylacetoacetate isomerase [Aliikangiella marina]
MLKLHGYWRSTAAYRVRIGLNLKQASYTQIPVHLVKDGGEQHKPEFRELNPQGLVPTLIDDGLVISQSIAILEYIDEKYPKPKLLPESIAERAITRQLCQVIACDTHPLNNLRVLQYLSNEMDITDEAKNLWYHHWLRLGFQAYEGLLALHEIDGPYSMGEELSLADACLIPQIYNAHRFNFPMEEFPRLLAINENCLKLERFQNAVPENQPDAGE